MTNETRKDSANYVLDWLFRLFILIALYYLINFDHSENLDYQTYKLNYTAGWGRFEPGFEFLLNIFRALGLSFSTVWDILVWVEIFFIALIYRERSVFYFALPNLYFLSQGMLGTQIRFAIAVLLFLFFFRAIKGKRLKSLFLATPFGLHSAIIILYLNAIFVNYFLRSEASLLTVRNTIWFLLFVVGVAIVALAVEPILMRAGYDYYVGTKYQQGKSIQSLVYIALSLCTVLFLIVRRKHRPFSDLIFFAALLSAFSLLLADSSVIAGRVALVYILLEPFVIATFFHNYGIKRQFFPAFAFYCLVIYSKAATISLV